MNIHENLENLNFTKLESEIYLCLLGAEPMSAYQLAKKIEISRSSIYNALEHMFHKGMVNIISDKTPLYVAEEPSIILGKMEKEMISSLNEAKKQLEEQKTLYHKETTLNFKGINTGILKTKNLIKNAKKEVYINADFHLDCFVEEFLELSKKGIRVIVFSFYEIKVPETVELYTHSRKVDENHIPSRLMVTVDEEFSLITNGGKEEDSWIGTISNNVLLSKILCEHIHNDIYILKLRDKYGREIYNGDLLLNTKFENKKSNIRK